MSHYVLYYIRCIFFHTYTIGLLGHMEQMRMDPKHQFAAQYVLRAANERRVEREALLAAAAMNINMSHFASTMGTGTISGSNAMLGQGGGGGAGGGGGLGGINCSPTGD